MKKFWENNIALAFDVSTRSTGWACYIPQTLIASEPLAKLQPLMYGVIQPPEQYCYLERIRFLHKVVMGLEPLLFMANKCYIFIEDGVYKHSIKTTMMLGEARGAVISACQEAPAIIEVGVSQWKKSCGCQLKSVKGEKKGELEKQMVRENMCKIWRHDFPQTFIKNKPTYDITDAIGILTHAINTFEFEEVIDKKRKL